MNGRYSDTIKALYASSSDALSQRINVQILAAIKTRARRKAYGFAAVSVVALIALIPAIQSVITQGTQSGLYEYISLFISDGGYVFSNLKEVILSIAETLPMIAITSVLASLFVAAYTARKATNYIRSIKAQTVSLFI